MIVLSHFQARPLLAARRDGAASAEVSLDLGLSRTVLQLDEVGVVLPDGVLPWAEVERIAAAETKCFRVEAGEAHEIRAFSETTGWVRSLYPTAGAPTTLVSGLPMHRIKATDPYRDTLAKIRAAGPLRGRVLDTATGLGYTAIEAARTADEVVTIELDPAALDIARQNPWSRPLFERPNITIVVGDATEVVAGFEPASFSAVIHDPPMANLAGDLYATEFYRALHRVLRPGGRLFHYIGDPNSPSGARTTSGVLRRLQAAGFTRITRRSEAFGVVARRS